MFFFQVFLQICIIATGNYNFFNFLTICLCISLLDDLFFYKRKSKVGASRTTNYLSTLICLLVYGAVVYGTYVYYNLKITDKWTIHSDIGIYCYFSYNLQIKIYLILYFNVFCFCFKVLLKNNLIMSYLVQYRSPLLSVQCLLD